VETTSKTAHRIDRRAALTLALALACALPIATASPAQTIVVPAPPLLNYAAVTSRREAARLVRKRLLVKIQFFPVELGGPKGAANTGYLPLAAALSHAQLVEMLSRYGERGLIDQLEIIPEYKGYSIIPTRLLMKASHSRGGKSFERVIEVWDCGFCAPLEPLPDPDAPSEITA
jgi:hypothetical protein